MKSVRGIMVRLRRRSVRPRVLMSIPSMEIFPLLASTKRKNERARVLFPEPVRPTTPIFSPGNTWKLRPWRTSGRSGYQGSREFKDGSEVWYKYRVADGEVLTNDFASGRPWNGRTGLLSFRRFTRQIRCFLDTFDGNLECSPFSYMQSCRRMNSLDTAPSPQNTSPVASQVTIVFWVSNLRNTTTGNRGFVNPRLWIASS
jgi:hypothetical protein